MFVYLSISMLQALVIHDNLDLRSQISITFLGTSKMDLGCTFSRSPSDPSDRTFTRRRHIFLELSTGGDFHSYIEYHGQLVEGEAKYIAYQLMKALDVSLVHHNLRSP